MNLSNNYHVPEAALGSEQSSEKDIVPATWRKYCIHEGDKYINK